MKITTKRICAFVLSLAFVAVIVLPLTVGAEESFTETFINAAGVESETDLPEMIGKIVQIVLSFLGIVAILIILLGGFKWMTAQGDETKVDKAKKLIYAGITGLVIIFAAYAIAIFVLRSLTEATGTNIVY